MSLHSTLRNQAINLPAADAPKTPRRLPANQTLWISIATLASVVALWWAVTALQLIGPLFYLLHSRSCISYGPLPARKVYGCHAMAASGC